ncbi:MAG TPA: hypothetical protein VF232_03570 [Gaiellaceae bacterium]
MKTRGLVLALAVLALGAIAPAAQAVDPAVVDIQECARNGGQATIPAGVPVSVQNFAFVTGTQGSMQNFLHKQLTSKGVLRGGTLTIIDVTDQWSEPQPIGPNPARGWITRLPNTELDALAPGEVVQVGSLTELTGPIEIVFPPVGVVGFGPFHVPAGDGFFQGCAITAQ